MRTIRVNVTKGYDVLIGDGLLDRAGELIRKTVGGNTAVVVTDETVKTLYADRLISVLAKANYQTLLFSIEPGEASKNPDNYIKLLNFLAENSVFRDDLVVALGGGVVGDLAGFAAATYMRGMRLAQIPTTLLAAVDSSVGGKTAIDLPTGKNLAGAFYQPDIVVCDHSLLKSLTKTVYADGCAEVIKYGVIADRELFYSLERPVSEHMEEVIASCIKIKRDIVQRDEFETGERKLLNFGHTVGHAIEKCSEYRISHGFAVAMGMGVVARIACHLGLCDVDCSNDIKRMLQFYDLPASTVYDVKELTGAMLSDKKRSGKTITMVIPSLIGKCVLKEFSVESLEDYIKIGLLDNGAFL